MIDLPALINKLRTAPQRQGTFGRGDSRPLDAYVPVLTAEERDGLVQAAESMMSMQQQSEMLRTSREG